MKVMLLGFSYRCRPHSPVLRVNNTHDRRGCAAAFSISGDGAVEYTVRIGGFRFKESPTLTLPPSSVVCIRNHGAAPPSNAGSKALAGIESVPGPDCSPAHATPLDEWRRAHRLCVRL